ncbi:ABC transporter substrate-binding protein [Pelagibacterium sp.]|uniref:ABC transporter substrate-binding protein n=1 Tax=Pelagibacterium sp. TaxID=1967288 RepID=UPI003BAC14A7|tara:strand:- start:5988 stop:7031 length:1044 start_codon:yes stop_codon:yes gene_type:complete
MKTSFYTISLAVLGVGLHGASATAQELIVNSYGGPYADIIQERIIKPFEEETGIRVIYDAVGTASEDYAKIKATRGNPGFDVNVMTATQSLDGCRDGFLEVLTEDNVPNLAYLDPAVRDLAGDCAAVHELQYVALLWRTDYLPEPPTSWSVLEQDELNGKIVLPNFGNIMAANMLQIFSSMEGGDPNEVDAGFAKMVELAPRAIAFPDTSALMDRYLREGQAWAMPYFSGRAQLMKDEGVPVDFTIPEEGSVPLVSTLNIPIGAPNKEAALQFVNFFLEKTSQEAWAEGYKVGSARSDIEVSEELQETQITTSEAIQQLILPDLAVMAERLPEWGERWEREVVPAAN